MLCRLAYSTYFAANSANVPELRLARRSAAGSLPFATANMISAAMTRASASPIVLASPMRYHFACRERDKTLAYC
jgi:hypothetical protein